MYKTRVFFNERFKALYISRLKFLYLTVTEYKRYGGMRVLEIFKYRRGSRISALCLFAFSYFKFTEKQFAELLRRIYIETIFAREFLYLCFEFGKHFSVLFTRFVKAF